MMRVFPVDEALLMLAEAVEVRAGRSDSGRASDASRDGNDNTAARRKGD